MLRRRNVGNVEITRVRTAGQPVRSNKHQRSFKRVYSLLDLTLWVENTAAEEAEAAEDLEALSRLVGGLDGHLN